MQRLVTVFALSAAALLSGCATKGSPATSPSTTQPLGTPSITFVNWQLTATSAVMGKTPLAFAGDISQTNSSLSGTLHVGGSNCFDQSITMALTGTITGSNMSLTSAVINGQVVTIAGNYLGNYTFAGTYSVAGGCDGGDQGTVTGVIADFADADSWGGTFTSSTQATFKGSGDFAQSSTASSDGSFGITGTATFDTPCFSASTISPGSLSSSNFVLGTLMSLEINTGNGTLTIVGEVDPVTAWMTGTYKVVGGTCDQTGTVILGLGGQWDYH